MLTMAEAARSRVLDQLSKGGPLAGIQVAAAAADPSQLDSDNPRPGATLPIDEAALRRIQALPGVSTMLPIVTAESIVVWDDQAADHAPPPPPPSVRHRTACSTPWSGSTPPERPSCPSLSCPGGCRRPARPPRLR